MVLPRSVRADSSVDYLDERALIACIRAGDPQAFDELVVAYWTPLRNFVATFVYSRSTADELVQDLFLKIWRMRAEWAVDSSVRSYLFRAARNAGLAYCRRERVVERWEARIVRRQEVPAMGSVGDSADRRVEASELGVALSQAIARLPGRCRQVAELRIQHELSLAEVAHVMGVTVKAVERQLTKALKVLRGEMAGYLRP